MWIYRITDQRTAQTTRPSKMKFGVHILSAIYECINKGFFDIRTLKGEKRPKIISLISQTRKNIDIFLASNSQVLKYKKTYLSILFYFPLKFVKFSKWFIALAFLSFIIQFWHIILLLKYLKVLFLIFFKI